MIAPAVFVVGLVVSVAMFATVLQRVPIDSSEAGGKFLDHLVDSGVAQWTWALLLVSGWIATIACVYININLFGLNAFYANRLVRCYLGALRPRRPPEEGRPNFAPTNSPVPVRAAIRSPGLTRPTTFRCATWPSSPTGATMTWWSTTAGLITW